MSRTVAVGSGWLAFVNHGQMNDHQAQKFCKPKYLANCRKTIKQKTKSSRRAKHKYRTAEQHSMGSGAGRGQGAVGRGQWAGVYGGAQIFKYLTPLKRTVGR